MNIRSARQRLSGIRESMIGERQKGTENLVPLTISIARDGKELDSFQITVKAADLAADMEHLSDKLRQVAFEVDQGG